VPCLGGDRRDHGAPQSEHVRERVERPSLEHASHVRDRALTEAGEQQRERVERAAHLAGMLLEDREHRVVRRVEETDVRDPSPLDLGEHLEIERTRLILRRAPRDVRAATLSPDDALLDRRDLEREAITLLRLRSLCVRASPGGRNEDRRDRRHAAVIPRGRVARTSSRSMKAQAATHVTCRSIAHGLSRSGLLYAAVMARRFARSVLGALILSAALSVWAGCVGDDPGVVNGGGDGGIVGEYGGKCFDDGKCKEGLVCVQGTACLRAGETIDGGPGGGDGGPGSDGGGGGGDAGVDGQSAADGGASCTVLMSAPDGFDCPLANGNAVHCDTSGNTPACCPGTGCAPAVGGCAGNKFHCLAASACTTAPLSVCCLNATLEDMKACLLPKRLNRTSSATGQCSTDCGTGQVQLCATVGDTTECLPGMTCRATSMLVGTIPFVVNVCMP
jgi:hypothetical protein